MVVPQPGWIGLTQIAGKVGLGIRIGQFLNRAGWRFWLWRSLWRLAGYEHVFVFTGALESQDGIVEAEPGGAVHVPFHYDASRVRWVLPPTPQLGVETALAAVGLIRTPYSFLDYLALALMRLRLPSKRLRAYVKATGHMICSQLADHAANLAGWHIFTDGRDEGDVTPEDFAAIAFELVLVK